MAARVVVVTGAGAGVGRAAARAFGERGDAVALLGRGAERLDAAREEITAGGARAIAIPTDVADAAAVEAAAELVEAELGPIDVWVNNAMATVFAPFPEIRPDEFRRVTEVTYLGSVYGTMAALRRMLPRDHGTIVQVSSALAHRGIPLQSAYCGAKHGMNGCLDSLRCELIHRGSRVVITEVEMPALNTPQFGWSRSRMPRKAQPVPPIYQPEVAAEAIVWASLHRRRSLAVGLPTVIAILGQRISPWLGDRYLGRTGVDAQQTDEPEDPRRLDNLFAPVPGDEAAHGAFDRVAKDGSRQLWLDVHRRSLALGAAALLTVAGRAWRR
jgi:NAD(P)-dependent dehydrogenase (short-subunit alcohol dehydrogenase family)